MGEQKKRAAYIGEVVSNAMDKTVVVKVESLGPHARYKRVIRRVSRFKAHDEENRCQVGDRVKIIGIRPLSKEKRWAVLEILERAEA
ncbi:MAG: 30S ribosomal protein S17 [Nitrospirae bacterium]|nr:30S ribosomal protein S17 [Nitrospirota bacterium]